MAKKGPIIILEEDKEDIEILEQAFTQLNISNQRHYFDNGKPIIDYLLTTKEQPFMLLSGIKASGMDGLELRENIQKDEFLRKKGIPFVFLSLDTRKQVIDKAYELTVQGFFEKENTIDGVVQQLKIIFQYWTNCKHPNA